MAVAFDASSESHTGTAGGTSTFKWTHTPVGSPKGVLAFTFVNNSTGDSVAAVSYGGIGLLPVSGGRAVDTAGETGDCKAWLLSPWSYAPSLASTATSGTSDTLRGVAYGNGYWMASGGVGTIIYKATDPSGSWSAATSGSGSTLQGSTYGNGYFVTAGSGGAIIYKATDPSGSWSAATSGTANGLQAVAYGNGYYAAVGGSGTVRYKATDPTGSWSGATSGTANSLQGVAYGDGYWVAVGDGGTIIYKATDPTGSWSAATSGTANGLRSVTYGNGYWVATSGAGEIVYKSGSDPSGSWSVISSGVSNLLRGVAYGGGYWIAAGDQCRYRKATPDGTWSGVVSTVQAGTATGAFTYADGYFVYVGGSGLIDYGQPPGDAPVVMPTGAQSAGVTTGTAETYAVAITVTADYGVEATGVVLQQGDQTLANTAVDDGSPGTNSVRFAGVFSGLSAVPSANAGSTELQNIDFGNQVISVIRETTAGQGSRSIGWTGASDDVAAVYLAIREAIVPWTVGVPIR